MERFQRSRTECFPICLLCSCCEYGKFSLENGSPGGAVLGGVISVSLIPDLPETLKLMSKSWPAPSENVACGVPTTPGLKALCPSLLLARVLLKDFIVDPNPHIWPLGM